MFFKGITVTLYERTETGRDAFNNPIFEETPVEVSNVLVAPTTAEEDTFTRSPVDLSGYQATYTLALPKGDAHEWLNCRVEFLGKVGRVIGDYSEGIELYMPLDWHRKIRAVVLNG